YTCVVVYSASDFHELAPFPTRRSSDLKRDFLVHPRRRPLAEEGEMRPADKRRNDKIGRRRLDLRDGRTEIGDIEREEIDGHGLRSEEHTSELQSRESIVCRLLLEKKKW